MKICLPVKNSEGIYSSISSHFGSAEAFLLLETETLEETVLRGGAGQDRPGRCAPVSALREHNVETVIVKGIGAGALDRLRNMGIKVLKSDAELVAGALIQLRDNKLEPFSSESTCRGHSQGEGSRHLHGCGGGPGTRGNL